MVRQTLPPSLTAASCLRAGALRGLPVGEIWETCYLESQAVRRRSRRGSFHCHADTQASGELLGGGAGEKRQASATLPPPFGAGSAPPSTAPSHLPTHSGPLPLRCWSQVPPQQAQTGPHRPAATAGRNENRRLPTPQLSQPLCVRHRGPCAC